ncbi:MAG: gamma carbonic anhydrase family protein [Microthrixaceae bacterium]
MTLYAVGDWSPTIAPTAFVHPDAVVIGDVTIGEHSSVWPTAVLRGDNGPVVVGARTSIQDGTVVHTVPSCPTTIGDEVTVGHNAHLEGCRVEHRALIGSGSIVLHRALVGEEALVGAGALVGNNKTVPARARALGIPAKVTENVVSFEQWAEGVEVYVSRARLYRETLRVVDPGGGG